MASFAKGLTSILSVLAVGAALALPPAFAADDGNSKNVSEEEILRALAPPPKKPKPASLRPWAGAARARPKPLRTSSMTSACRAACRRWV